VQVTYANAVGGRIVDRYGRAVEVITLDRGHGPQQWIRVSWRGILLGPGATFGGIGQGYYRSVSAALAHVDASSLVEVIPLPARHRQEPYVSDLDSAHAWAAAVTAHTEDTGWLPEDVATHAAERGTLCGVALDLNHPDVDLAACVVASRGGWVVAYDHDAGAWTAW
jgi:hypothetical protein